LPSNDNRIDVTIQAQIMQLLRELQEEIGMSVILISHDLGLVAEFAERVVVMYAGQVVEQAMQGRCRSANASLYRRPAQSYSRSGE